jgi:23S rRNA (guanosine2251-2'-O)-methyltransferase
MSSTKIKLSTSELEIKHAKQQSPIPSGALIVCLHNIRSLHNVGSAFRSSDAFGVSKLLLTGYTPHPPRIEISKTALGADEWVPWEHHTDGLLALTDYKRAGWKLVSIEQTNRSVPLPQGIPDPRHEKLILIFGNEVLGLDDNVIEISDYVADIPQYGRKHSLNVSVSLGIALFAVHERSRI